MKTLTWLVWILFIFSLAGCSGWMANNGQSAGSEKDLSASLASDNGLYTVSYRSEMDPPSINQIHAWVLRVETAGGEPVEQAIIRVQGAMPDHGHGLPTQPKVTQELGGGEYRVEGVKYSMTGWWTMTFEISAAGQTDTVTFNLILP
jgi:hypothetical protein